MDSYTNWRKLNYIIKKEIAEWNSNFVIGEWSTKFKNGTTIDLSELEDWSVKIRVVPQTVWQLYYTISENWNVKSEDRTLDVSVDEKYKWRNKPAIIAFSENDAPRYNLEEIIWATWIDISRTIVMK